MISIHHFYYLYCANKASETDLEKTSLFYYDASRFSMVGL